MKKPKCIKDKRNSLNKTQLEISEAVGISEPYYNLIENGKRRPAIDIANKISKELNLTMDEFFLLYKYTKCKVNFTKSN